MKKLRVDPPAHVLVAPLADGQLDIEDAIVRAGWDQEDPGQGVAVIDRFGREVVNPARIEEPAGIDAGQDMMAVMERRIIERLQRDAGILRGDDVVDESEEEANDFNVADDIYGAHASGYEVEMASEFPTMPAPARRPAEEAALDLREAEAELAALQKRVDERRLAVEAAKPKPVVEPAAVPSSGT